MAICGAGEIHTRVYFARHTIATAKIRDYSQSIAPGVNFILVSRSIPFLPLRKEVEKGS